jgi:hypothetical protein
VTRWLYELPVPDDAEDGELDVYREIAEKLWRTASETAGAYGSIPTATLVSLEEPQLIRDKATGELVPEPRRRWRIEGQVT